MNLRTDKIKEIANLYNVPEQAAALCVDDLGGVDREKLAIAVHTMEGVKEGLTARDQAEVEALRKELKETYAAAKLPGANVQALITTAIKLKTRIFNLGGRP